MCRERLLSRGCHKERAQQHLPQELDGMVGWVLPNRGPQLGYKKMCAAFQTQGTCTRMNTYGLPCCDQHERFIAFHERVDQYDASLQQFLAREKMIAYGEAESEHTSDDHNDNTRDELPELVESSED